MFDGGGNQCGTWHRSEVSEFKSGRAGFGSLRGGFLVEVIGCSLGVSGCRKNGAVVVLENLQPSRDIGSVFLPRFLVQFEIGAQESRSKFRNEFLVLVAFISKGRYPSQPIFERSGDLPQWC